ncbi:MAG TPA: PEP-CTERM sorting domain-containing protein, partial [Tepidisphaeraceae bacterium]|nr:PEP-CTERM sorting domain-containing protein [Tepidisphaeraceae bacterium]
LTVGQANAGTQTVDLASPSGAGLFHSLTVYAANLPAAKAALYNAILNANQPGAADPDDGIKDSGLHANAKVGLAQKSNNIYIRPTRVGDLNLDGQVTISDFIDLASNFNTIGTATWQEGDLNYDRNVTISDFIDLASNFNASYSGEVVPISAADAQALSDFASAHGVVVPEPGTIGLLVIGAGLLARRRRR